MNDHNLDDLIISEPDPRGGKSKNILTLVALVAIIVIVGIILYQLILGGGEEEPAAGNGTELTTMVNPSMQKKSDRQAQAPQEEIPEELKPIVDEKLPEASPKPAPRTEPKQAEPKPAATPEATPKPKPKPKPVSKPKPAPKPSELFKKSESKSGGTASDKVYYIQVGAFKRPPTQKFLDTIKAKGYEPILVKSGNVIKVRIGSWGSYADAKAKLPEIKEKLGIDGFVVRKK